MVAEVHRDVGCSGVLHHVAQRLAGDLGDVAHLLGAQPAAALSHHLQIHSKQRVQTQVPDQVFQDDLQFAGLLCHLQVKDIAADVLDGWLRASITARICF